MRTHRQEFARTCGDVIIATEGSNIGMALNMAAMLEIDAVIDPAETRNWLVRGLASASPNTAPQVPHVKTW